MAPTPRPDGWEGGSEDFSFLRTLDGHVGTNPNIEDAGACADEDYRRNDRFEFRDLGGHYETHGSESYED